MTVGEVILLLFFFGVPIFLVWREDLLDGLFKSPEEEERERLEDIRQWVEEQERQQELDDKAEGS